MRHKNIVLSIALAVLAFSCSQEKKLPFMGPKTVNAKGDTVYHQIPAFRFLNQDSIIVTEKDVEGKVYVADFFFTTCPTICPKMKTQMLRIYERYKDRDDVRILSHSIDPDFDNTSVLKDYAARLLSLIHI
jgi:protein SCO1/2